MKKAFLLCGVLLAMTASIAGAAPGMSLRWDACFGDGGTTNRNFACNTNVGVHSLRGSFVVGDDPQLTYVFRASGIAAVVDIATASTVLPGWWEIKNPGSCRQFALSIQAYDGVHCFDWALGQASMFIAGYDHGVPAPNAARIKILNAVVVDDLELDGGKEYTAFALNINNAGTVGTTCSGCTVPACIELKRIQVDGRTSLPLVLTGPANQSSHYVTWQGGAGANCPAVTRTTVSSWSEVKSLYR